MKPKNKFWNKFLPLSQTFTFNKLKILKGVNEV